MAETTILLVSELVTNAVVHARCPAVLRLSFPIDPDRGAEPGDLLDTAALRQSTGTGEPEDSRHRSESATQDSPPADVSPAVSESGDFEAPGRVAETDSPAGRQPLRIEVSDASSAAPVATHAPPDQTGGRGLDLVDVLADRWGWQPDGPGKRVWCEIDRDSDGAEGAAAPAPALTG